jgi:hypothetical protein
MTAKNPRDASYIELLRRFKARRAVAESMGTRC